jgi:hypothetical protein
MSIVANWDSFKNEVLDPAISSLETEIAESYAHTLGMVLARDIAERTNTNIDLLEVSSEVEKSSQDHQFVSCVYDDLEGGSGTALSYHQQVNGALDLGDIFQHQCACPTAAVESNMILILTDPRHDAESLHGLAQSNGDTTSWEDQAQINMETALRLRRLLASPAIAAFYQGAADNFKHLHEVLKRTPTSIEVAISLLERPITDPRGQSLVEQFAALRGGISELVPRIEEIMPHCIGSCPDCLGDSRLSFSQGDKSVPDRNLLLQIPEL